MNLPTVPVEGVARPDDGAALAARRVERETQFVLVTSEQEVRRFARIHGVSEAHARRIIASIPPFVTLYEGGGA